MKSQVLDRLFSQFESLSENQIVDMVSYIGPALLEDRRAARPEFAATLAPLIPMGLPWLKAILADKKIQEIYFDNSRFNKDTFQITDPAIFVMLAKHKLICLEDLDTDQLRDFLKVQATDKKASEAIVQLALDFHAREHYLSYINNPGSYGYDILIALADREPKVLLGHKKAIALLNDDFILKIIIECIDQELIGAKNTTYDLKDLFFKLSEDKVLWILSRLSNQQKEVALFNLIVGSSEAEKYIALASSTTLHKTMAAASAQQAQVIAIELAKRGEVIERVYLIDIEEILKATINPSQAIAIFKAYREERPGRGLERLLYNLLETKSPFLRDIIETLAEDIAREQLYIRGLEDFKDLIDFSQYESPSAELMAAVPELADHDLIEREVNERYSSAITFLKNPQIEDKTFLFLIDVILNRCPHTLFANAPSGLTPERQMILFDKLSDGQKAAHLRSFNAVPREVVVKIFLEAAQSDFIDVIMLNKDQFQAVYPSVRETIIQDKFRIAHILKYFTHCLEAEQAQELVQALAGLERSAGAIVESEPKEALIEKALVSFEVLTRNFDFFCFGAGSSRAIAASDFYEQLNDRQKVKIAIHVPRFKNEFSSQFPERFCELCRLCPDKDILYILSAKDIQVLAKNNIVLENAQIDPSEIIVSLETLPYLSKYVKDEKSLVQLTASLRASQYTEKEWSVLKQAFEKFPDYLQQGPLITKLINSDNPVIDHELVFDFISEPQNFGFLEDLDEEKWARLGRARILKVLNHIDAETNKNFSFLPAMMKASLEQGLIEVEEFAQFHSRSIISEVMNHCERWGSQIMIRFVRALREANKKSAIPSDYVTSYEVLEPGHPWDFYAEATTRSFCKSFSKDDLAILKQNLLSSLDKSSAQKCNSEIIEYIAFSRAEWAKILSNASLSVVEEALNSIDTEVNGHEILEMLRIDPSPLIRASEAGKDIDDIVISLTQKGVKGLFKLGLKLDLQSYSMTSFLWETSDSDLVDLYLNNRQWMNVGNFKANKDIIQRASQTVTKDDIKMEFVSVESKRASLRIAGVDIVSVAQDKTTKRWKYVSGARKDLASEVIAFAKKINETYPKRIRGQINIEDGKFDSKTDSSFHFELGSQDSDRIELMKQFGVTGFIAATAVRKSDMTYKVDVHFDKESSLGLADLEKEIKRKTFDTSEKLDELLKINPKRTFGFELELAVRYSNRHQIAKDAKQMGLKVIASSNFSKSEGKEWHFKEDGSLDDSFIQSYDDDGDAENDGDVFEIASPILSGNRGIAEARKLLNRLFNQYEVESGQEVNAGLHVHHDINDLLKIADRESDIIKTFLPFQDTLYGLVEDWRIESDYCQPIKMEEMEYGRFSYGASGVLVSNHGTLEFRMKEGVTNTEEIIKWIIYTQNVVEMIAAKIKDQVKKRKKSIENFSEATALMILQNRYGNKPKKITRSNIQEIRKLVGLQEKLYAAA